MSMSSIPLSRRHFINLGLVTAGLQLCGGGNMLAAESQNSARLHSRLRQPKLRAMPGRHSFGLGGAKDGYLSVPSSSAPGKGLPLIVMLHGARGPEGLDKFCDAAAKDGIAVAVPESRGQTWDGMKGSFGPDIAFLDRILAYTFDRLNVDPRRLGIAGFSDGASYALSVGLCNGDIFSHVIAYSPAFAAAPVRFGKPPVFIAHGVQDQVLPINSTEQIVRGLKQAGYAVDYRAFTGNHMMRPDVVKESFRWFLG
jgi:phospholipase/carboxylesterase